MGDPSYVYPAPDMPPYDRGPAVVTDENQSQSLQSDHSRGSFGPQRFANTLASGKVKEQRLKSRLGGDIAVFIEMDDGGGDVFLSGRVSPRLPASGARVTFRLSLTAERRWVAKNGEWLYEGFLAQAARPVPRRPGARVEGVVSTRKPSSACCWITIGDLDGGVYCLSKWCPGAASPPLGAIVSCELKQGKYGDWRVASPPGLAVVTQEARFLETGRLFDDAPPSPRSGADLWHAAPAYYPPARADRGGDEPDAAVAGRSPRRA
ncbi:hypothetical protein JL722_6317 [Aureococcus anophagefferens]|nr:hypothetical protein JL722_6317 [Aureococcus anophagefferens]